ncbi:hypothetical protein [Kitasatospora sp. NPDC059673]|uniref:hypothetical protein n=1 Tax=Kitasatospora sp. NPDC059673 TaxID=3346901 RepID=UPI0036919D7E
MGRSGGSIGLAVLATAAGARTEVAGGSSPAGYTAGYHLVFLAAACLGPVLAVAGVLLTRHGRGDGDGGRRDVSDGWR